MNKILVAMMNEMTFLFNNVNKMTVDFPNEYNPYFELVLTYEYISDKATLLENVLHDTYKRYTKTIDYNKWLEYYSYSFIYNDTRIVCKLVGYRNTI